MAPVVPKDARDPIGPNELPLAPAAPRTGMASQSCSHPGRPVHRPTRLASAAELQRLPARHARRLHRLTSTPRCRGFVRLPRSGRKCRKRSLPRTKTTASASMDRTTRSLAGRRLALPEGLSKSITEMAASESRQPDRTAIPTKR